MAFSQPGFMEKGDGLLSSSPDQATGAAVDAVTGFFNYFFFPLARCCSGINRAESMDGDFPCKLQLKNCLSKQKNCNKLKEHNEEENEMNNKN